MIERVTKYFEESNGSRRNLRKCSSLPIDLLKTCMCIDKFLDPFHTGAHWKFAPYSEFIIILGTIISMFINMVNCVVRKEESGLSFVPKH